jgi:hypothetical protein
MNQSGQGPDWTIDRPDAEAIDFEYEFEVIPLVREVPVRIFLKHAELQVMPSLSWINLSDQLVKKWDLPKGTLLRIFPVDGRVDNRDEEDHSYTFEWEEGKQYWYDIAYDPWKDAGSRTRTIKMIDRYGRVDRMVVKKNATEASIIAQWAKLLDNPPTVQLAINTRNNEEYYWPFHGTYETLPCIFRTPSGQGDARIIDGPAHFRAEQLGRALDIKIPPFGACQVTREDGGPVIIQYHEEAQRLGLRILNEHVLGWNLEGQILWDPNVSTWWLPYDFRAIARYGHTINSGITDDMNQRRNPCDHFME